MSPTLHSLGIDQLPRDRRLELVQAIWDSIAAEPYPPMLSEAQRQELERRIREDEANPGDEIPWEQAKQQVLSRLQQP